MISKFGQAYVTLGEIYFAFGGYEHAITAIQRGPEKGQAAEKKCPAPNFLLDICNPHFRCITLCTSQRTTPKLTMRSVSCTACCFFDHSPRSGADS
jgi:hypothetical protein